ncbi:MAG: DUF4013 domain-containing protein [Halolamina sp.]
MLEDGLSYPARGDDALGRVVIGGILGFGSVLVVPAFLLLGYLVRVLEQSARNVEEPPSFEDWGGLLVDGLKATAVVVVYGLVPFGLLAVSGTVFAGGVVAGGETVTGVVGGLGALGLLVSLLATALLYYLVPAALSSMAVQGSFGDAFDAGTLKSLLLSADYLLAWFVPFVIAVALNVVVAVLALTVVGLLVVPFLQFYVQVAVFYMFGAAYGTVVGVDDAGPESAATAAV